MSEVKVFLGILKNRVKNLDFSTFLKALLILYMLWVVGSLMNFLTSKAAAIIQNAM